MDWTKQAGGAAEQYSSFLVPAMFEPCAQLLLEAAGVADGMTVLDVACGTGVVSRAAAARGAQVTGVDLGEPMIAVARSLGGENIEYVQGDATALPVQDGAYDAVLMQHGLMFVPDKLAAVKELLRAVKPGGPVAIACWHPLAGCPVMHAISDALAEHVSPEASAMMQMPFSVSPDDLDELLAEAGADDIIVASPSFPATFAAREDIAHQALLAGPVAASYLEVDEEVRAMLNADVAQATEQYGGDGTTTAPMTTALALARRPA